MDSQQPSLEDSLILLQIKVKS